MIVDLTQNLLDSIDKLAQLRARARNNDEFEEADKYTPMILALSEQLTSLLTAQPPQTKSAPKKRSK